MKIRNSKELIRQLIPTSNLQCNKGCEFWIFRAQRPFQNKIKNRFSLPQVRGVGSVGKSPALYSALYRTLPVICTSGCLVVFHNKQVKRSWYSHNRERAMGFSLKTVGFSLKWLLFWMCKCSFACLWALSTWNEKSLPWAAHSLMRFSDFRPCGQGRAASK